MRIAFGVRVSSILVTCPAQLNRSWSKIDSMPCRCVLSRTVSLGTLCCHFILRMVRKQHWWKRLSNSIYKRLRTHTGRLCTIEQRSHDTALYTWSLVNRHKERCCQMSDFLRQTTKGTTGILSWSLVLAVPFDITLDCVKGCTINVDLRWDVGCTWGRFR